MSSFNPPPHFTIRPLIPRDEVNFLQFSDKWIGKGYFNYDDFNKIIELSSTTVQGKKISSSFVVLNENSEAPLQAIRISFFPGKWIPHVSTSFLSNLTLNLNLELGYFKSLFIVPSLQQMGLGQHLSQLALNSLQCAGAKAIIAHCWKESPHNSSSIYLKKFGFTPLGDIPNYWKLVNYLCGGCQQQPCLCTATEMIYFIKSN